MKTIDKVIQTEPKNKVIYSIDDELIKKIAYDIGALKSLLNGPKERKQGLKAALKFYKGFYIQIIYFFGYLSDYDNGYVLCMINEDYFGEKECYRVMNEFINSFGIEEGKMDVNKDNVNLN